MKYHNHTLQTNAGYCEEEPENSNSHKTPGRHTGLVDVRIVALYISSHEQTQ